MTATPRTKTRVNQLRVTRYLLLLAALGIAGYITALLSS